MNHLLLACLTAGSLWVCSLRAADNTGSPQDVFVTGRNIQITRGEVDEAVDRHTRELLNSGKLLREEDRPQVVAAILDRLVFVRLVMARATDADKIKGAENARKAMDEVRARAGTDSAYHRLLQRAGVDEASFKKLKIEEQTTLAVLDREIRAKLNIDAEAVAKYYNDNPDRFERPELIKVAHLLLSTREAGTGRELSEEQKKEKRRLIDALLVRVKKGEDFAALVKQHSEDAATRGSGGELTLARGQTVVEFEAVAGALSPGQVSDVVTTQYGYHIIKGVQHRPAGKMTLAEVSKDIRDFLSQKEFERQIAGYTERLKKEAGVEFTPLAPRANTKPATAPKAK